MLGSRHASGVWRSEPEPGGEPVEGRLSVLADQVLRLGLGLLPRRLDLPAGAAFPLAVSRIVWFRPPAGGSDSSQPFCFMSSTSRLRVDFSIRSIRQTSAGRPSPMCATATRMFAWLTRSPKGRSASSYSVVITRLISRTRTAMHSPATRSRD